jgi:hypothetical protein
MKATRKTLHSVRISGINPFTQFLTIADLKENRESIIAHITEQAGKENVVAVMTKMVEMLGEERCEKELALKAIDELGVSKFKNAAEDLAIYHRNIGRRYMNIH